MNEVEYYKRKKEIRQLAEKVFRILYLNAFNPIDMKNVIISLGGFIEEVEENSHYVEKAGDRFFCVLDRKLSKEAKNYYLAYCLGHLFVSMNYMVSPEDWNKLKDGERYGMGTGNGYRMGDSILNGDADDFAMWFLMPEAEFWNCVKFNSKDNMCSIDAVVKKFCVPRYAVIRRGKDLKLFPKDW